MAKKLEKFPTFLSFGPYFPINNRRLALKEKNKCMKEGLLL